MPPVTLYYAPFACSLSDHIALKLAKLQYKLVQVDLGKKKTKHGDDYLKISPTGAVPALQLEDNKVLTQNVAILSYIGEMSTFPSFKPESSLGKARYLEALGFDADLHSAVAGWAFFGNNEAGFKKRLGELESFLPSSGYWFGTSEPSQPDIYTAVILNWAVRKNIKLDPWPKAKALHKTIFDLEVVQEALKEEEEN